MNESVKKKVTKKCSIPLNLFQLDICNKNSMSPDDLLTAIYKFSKLSTFAKKKLCLQSILAEKLQKKKNTRYCC